MSKLEEETLEILNFAKMIFENQENNNPHAIFSNKIFLIGRENDQDIISVEYDYEKNDSSYYFANSEIRGVIIRRESGNYCIKAAVKYRNNNNQNLWFAKIRIESSTNGNMQIMGSWGGSWESPDYQDSNFISKPNRDLSLALASMKQSISNIYNQLSENSKLSSDLYDPTWVKKLKKYN